MLVSCRKQGSQLIFQVWDTGIGIGEQALPHIFDEFYQVNTSRPLQAHHRKGLGLGLSIVRRCVHLQGYSISVDSREGRGSVFKVTMPLAAGHPAGQDASPAAQAWPTRKAMAA